MFTAAYSPIYLPSSPTSTNGINLINVDDAGGNAPGLLEQISHPSSSKTYSQPPTLNLYPWLHHNK